MSEIDMLGMEGKLGSVGRKLDRSASSGVEVHAAQASKRPATGKTRQVILAPDFPIYPNLSNGD
jgi:hypothetical protein